MAAYAKAKPVGSDAPLISPLELMQWLAALASGPNVHSGQPGRHC